MANIPVISPEAWEAVKAASIRGVPDAQLAESFGVEKNAIRQRRFLDPVWKAAYNANAEALKGKPNEVEAEKAPNGEKLTGNLTKGSETAFLAQKVGSTISGSIASLSENNLLLASRIAQRGLKRADAEFDALPIENMGDVERIFKMAAMAGKWNAPNIEVKQAFAFGGGRDDDTILECDTEIVEDSGSYDDGFNLSSEE